MLTIRRCLEAIFAAVYDATHSPYVAELGDVRFSAVDFVALPSGAVVRCKGTLLHSSLAVRAIDIRYVSDAALAEIRIGLARAGASGSFLFDVPLKPGINSVLFGKQQASIWGDVHVPAGLIDPYQNGGVDFGHSRGA
jgi:hypothetical protein